MVKMRPAEIEGVLNPVPRPLAVHASGGPSLGHFCKSPVSFDWAVRC
jgi:hypothetical protein